MKNDGDDLEWVAEHAKTRGVAPPEFLKDRPTIRHELHFYWQAFNELCTERTMNGHIPIRAIHDYGDRYGVSSETFRVIMLAMDATWAEKRK